MGGAGVVATRAREAQSVTRQEEGPPSRAVVRPARTEARERGLCNGISPWLAPLAMVATQDLVLPAFFGQIRVLGREHLPEAGPVLLAPTHRARWDALLLPLAAGVRVSGRHCRFMVTLDEMQGLQGWFLHRLGCFPVNQGRPSLASLRYTVDLLADGQQLVVFPEGRIQRDDSPLTLQPGLARLALLVASQGVKVPVIPVGIAYGQPRPQPGAAAAVCFAPPLRPEPSVGGRGEAAAFTAALAVAMGAAEAEARKVLGRPMAGPTHDP